MVLKLLLSAHKLTTRHPKKKKRKEKEREKKDTSSDRLKTDISFETLVSPSFSKVLLKQRTEKKTIIIVFRFPQQPNLFFFPQSIINVPEDSTKPLNPRQTGKLVLDQSANNEVWC